MSSENGDIEEKKVNVECPSCNKAFAVLTTYSGRIGCPHCGKEFVVKSAVRYNFQKNEEYLELVVTQDQSFWIGFFIPIIPPIMRLVLLSLGVNFGGGSPDIMGLLILMTAIGLWPILGFTLAYSSGTFVKNFRDGARFSGVISLFLGGFAFLMFFSLISGGITN